MSDTRVEKLVDYWAVADGWDTDDDTREAGLLIAFLESIGLLVVDPADEATVERITEALRPLWAGRTLPFSRRHVALLTLAALKGGPG